MEKFNKLATLTHMKALKAEIEKKQAEFDALKDMCIEYMQENSTNIIDCTSIRATLTECTKTTFDAKQYKKDNPDYTGKYDKVTKYNRFNIG